MATAYNAFQVEAFSFPSLISRGWPGVWLFPGSSLRAQRYQITLNTSDLCCLTGLWGSSQWFPCLAWVCTPLPPHLLLLSHPHGDPQHVWTLRLVLPTRCKFIKMDLPINVKVLDHHVECGDVLHWRTTHLPLCCGHLCPRLWNSFHKSGEDFGATELDVADTAVQG